MTNDELNARLEQLSDEDLQDLADPKKPSVLRKCYQSDLRKRMAREIIDLRLQLSARYCEDVVHLDGINEGVDSLCRIINEILDCKHSSVGTASEPWESVRRRLMELVQDKQAAHFRHTNQMNLVVGIATNLMTGLGMGWCTNIAKLCNFSGDFDEIRNLWKAASAEAQNRISRLISLAESNHGDR